MGRAMINISATFAQIERETIAERIKDNMLELSRTGRWLGGTPPLGFKSVQITENSEPDYTCLECGGRCVIFKEFLADKEDVIFSMIGIRD